MYCGVTDIVERWIYTRQGVHQLIQRIDFPSPAFTINKGRTKVGKLADIVAFEEKNPEVIDESARRERGRAMRRALRKKGGRSRKGPHNGCGEPYEKGGKQRSSSRLAVNLALL